MTQQFIMAKMKKLKDDARRLVTLGEEMQREADELYQLVESHYFFNPGRAEPLTPQLTSTVVRNVSVPAFSLPDTDEEDVRPPEFDVITPDPVRSVRAPRSPRARQVRHRYTADETRNILELREQKKSWSEIGRVLGLSSEKVRDHYRIVTGRK